MFIENPLSFRGFREGRISYEIGNRGASECGKEYTL